MKQSSQFQVLVACLSVFPCVVEVIIIAAVSRPQNSVPVSKNYHLNMLDLRGKFELVGECSQIAILASICIMGGGQL